MASADQVKALIASLTEGDEAHFYAIAMQIAAHESRMGHGKVADEIRQMIDRAKSRVQLPSKAPIPLARPRGEVAELLSVSYPSVKLNHMILSDQTRRKLERVIREQRAIQVIRNKGLSPRRKLLLIGNPGTGKTMTASALAGELGLPLFVVRLDGLITKFMGETAAKLRLIFEALNQTRGVYLFDEFDSIGSSRGMTNDVGEIRRVLNSFLQMVEQDNSDSLVIAATNHVGMLDRALFRRFDDVIEYSLPDAEQICDTLRSKLSGFPAKRIQWVKAAALAEGLNFADITRACEDAIKDALVHERNSVTQADLAHAIEERKFAVTHKQTSSE
jgi:SpoVK/Ycf46/Vps4 family AAA+-type ATPase